ncbi:MAG: ribose-phosphate pyrophosphokinase [Patescibacteria group bacterium]|nr:ribose-phosphate pyrophosphokinase [Patescibacteria group bacterium]
MRLIAGSSNPQLATEVATALGVSLVKIASNIFANGERRVKVKDDVRGQDVVILQSFSSPADQQIIEFLLLTDALERMGAKSVEAVIPWMGYSLQDKVFSPGEPISAKVVADLVSNSFVRRVVLIDLHNTSIPAFFSVPTTHISAEQLMLEYVKDHLNHKQTVVVSPDFGGLKRSRQFAKQLDVELLNINKHRDLQTGKVTEVSLQGDVKGKQVILYDDIIVGGSTAVETAKLLHAEGAKQIYFLATHGLFAGGALDKIKSAPIEKVVITNTIYHQTLPHNVETISIAKLIADEVEFWK